MEYVGITHANCFDGMTCKWILHNTFKHIELVDGIYGKPPPCVEGKTVIMADFSYDYDTITQMARSAHSIYIFDHHKTAQAALLNNMPDNVYVMFDMIRCGAAILYNHYNSGLPLPVLIDYIQDRDLWLHKLKNTEEISALIASYDFTFENWDLLSNRIQNEAWHSLVSEGAALLRAKERFIYLTAKNAYRGKLPESFGKFAGLPCMLINTTYQYISDILHLLCKINNIPAIGFFKRADGMWQYSFRSMDELDDVSEWAKFTNGGGHRNASGGQLPDLLF